MSTKASSSSPPRATERPSRQARTGPLLRLAWRNIWRHKRRTTLLLVVVAYATMSTIFFWGLTEGFSESVLANQARYLSAPALITIPAYQDDPDPENALPHMDFIAEIEGVAGVRGSAPRLELFALLRSPYTSQSAQVRGVDPGLEPSVSNLPEAIGEGRMLENTGEVVLGYRLAERLDIRLGERLAMDVSSLAGPQAAGLRLVGIVDSGIPGVDETTALIHLDDARTLTGVETATGVALDIPRGREDRVAEAVQNVLPDEVRAYGLMELLGPLRQEIEASRISLVPIGLLFAVFAALAVTSTVLVSVIERTRELGMMAAIGLAPPRLSRMVIIESVLTTTAGWLIGLALGYGLTWIFGTWNILGPVFSYASEGFAEFGLSDELYTASHAIFALYAAGTIALAAIFAIFIPARKVSKLNPVEAMRTE